MKKEFVLGDNLNPRLFISLNGQKIEAEKIIKDNQYLFSFENIKACLNFQYTENGFRYTVKIQNEGNEDFTPETLGLDIGIDTCMATYPEWNDIYFPTFFRCEKTHFYGLLKKPNGETLGICCKQPIASYSHNFNSSGHRIYNSQLDFLNCPPLPKHHPLNCHILKAKEAREYVIDFFACSDDENWRENLAETYGLPMINAEKFTLEKGEYIRPVISSNKEYKTTLISPSGKEIKDFLAKDYGLYSLEVQTADGFSSTAYFYCRKPFEWYLKNAREEVINKMPHATTHCESWYGFFSGFLAAQHYPDTEKDEIINNMFQEIMPLCFDFENIKPKLIQKGIGAFYDTNEEGNPVGAPLGEIVSMSKIKAVKGMDMSRASFICFDEFIPQSTEVVRRKEGEAFADFVMTVIRDKVKRGQRLQLVLFANAEEISTPLTNAFELVDDMAELAWSGKSHYYNQERRILLHHITQAEIPLTKEELNSDMFVMMKGTAWAQKAFFGDFANNDFSNVKTMSVKTMKCIHLMKFQKNLK